MVYIIRLIGAIASPCLVGGLLAFNDTRVREAFIVTTRPKHWDAPALFTVKRKLRKRYFLFVRLAALRAMPLNDSFWNAKKPSSTVSPWLLFPISSLGGR
jgi:hypothetical protein